MKTSWAGPGEEQPLSTVSPGGKVAEVRRVTHGPKRAPSAQPFYRASFVTRDCSGGFGRARLTTLRLCLLWRRRSYSQQSRWQNKPTASPLSLYAPFSRTAVVGLSNRQWSMSSLYHRRTVRPEKHYSSCSRAQAAFSWRGNQHVEGLGRGEPPMGQIEHRPVGERLRGSLKIPCA